MFKTLSIILLATSFAAYSQDLILPNNATPLDKSVLTYHAKTNNTLKDVFESWSKKAYHNSGGVIWDVGEYVNIKNISISSGIELSGSFKDVINKLLSRINKLEFAQANNIKIYTCLYSDRKLVVKTINSNDFKKGVSNEKCI